VKGRALFAAIDEGLEVGMKKVEMGKWTYHVVNPRG